MGWVLVGLVNTRTYPVIKNPILVPVLYPSWVGSRAGQVEVRVR